MLEEQFANDVGKAIGRDPRVIFTQEQLEGAYAPGGTGGLNFLNLKTSTVNSLGVPYAGSSSGGFAHFSSLAQAENATIAEYKSPAIGINPSLPPPTPRGQISEIANTGWDATHYAPPGSPPSQYGANFFSKFGQLFGTQALDRPSSQSQAGFGGEIGHILSFGIIPANQFGKPSAQNLAGTAGAAAGAAGGALLGTFKDFFGVSFTQVTEMLAGGVLILLGLTMIVLGGRGSPQGQTVRAVRTVAR